MNAVVTDHAVDRLRTLASSPAEMAEAGALMRAIDQARNLTELVTLLPGSVQLSRGKNGSLLSVRHGQMRAVIAIVPEEPGKMVVVSVYRAGEEDPEGDVRRVDAALGEDVAHAG